MIILSAAPVHAYTTPWMHAPEFDGGWSLLDPSTWSDPNEWQRQTALTGGWGGLRQTLHNDGIDFTGLYMMESAGNPIGGDLHKLRYTHDLGLAIYLDLGKLLGLKHTYFLVSASQRVGNNLSGDIPNFFQVQQEFGHPTMRLDNLVVEEQLLDGRLDVVAGRIKATDDFAYSWVACYSQNLGLEGAPVLLVLINGRGPAEPWIDMDHLCPAFSALDHPLEPHRVIFRHVRSHDQHGVCVAQVL